MKAAVSARSVPCHPVYNRFILARGVRNPMKMLDIGCLKTEPNQSQNSKTENSVSAVRFSKNRLRRFGVVKFRVM